MTTITLASADDMDGFRAAVRRLIAAGIPPGAVTWRAAGEVGDLLGGSGPPPAGDASELRVPKAFPELARRVICHRDPERFALLHRALVALQSRPHLLEDSADPLVRRLDMLAKAVGRDVHKMRAFVRFREVPDESSEAGGAGERFVAWFEPEHHIVRLNSGFFIRRFANMRFSILTPDLCLHWDGKTATYTPGAHKADRPDGDPVEATWRTYDANIFNPARLKIAAMTSEMPKKYWKNLPEADLIPGLIAGAAKRTRTMIDAGSEPPPSFGLNELRAQASACHRCPLWQPATQAVFGEGPVDAVLMLVGEQPGDEEDVAGRPFIGPAGQVLDAALAEAGIDRARAWVTNAVKHFKFDQRGPRRIHARPAVGEIDACRWWLDAERAALKPRIIVALGATAARGLTGRAVTIARERGRAIPQPDGSELWITIHPSYLLRIDDPAVAAAERAHFIADLRAVADRVRALSGEV